MVRDGRLELPTSCSQSKRATNCANPGFLVIQFCTRCGQTCGHGDFLTTSTCGGSACIAGVSRDCGHGIFWLERGASCSQTRRDTNFAIPGYSLFCHDTTARGKNKVFSVCGQSCGQSHFCAAFSNRGKSRKCRRRKALRRFALPCPGYRHGTPKNQARYQLRYTRISTGGAFAPPAYCTLLSARTQGGSETFFHPGLPPAGKTAPQASSASRRQTLTPAMARAKTNQKMLITRG